MGGQEALVTKSAAVSSSVQGLSSPFEVEHSMNLAARLRP